MKKVIDYTVEAFEDKIVLVLWDEQEKKYTFEIKKPILMHILAGIKVAIEKIW